MLHDKAVSILLQDKTIAFRREADSADNPVTS